MGGGGLGGVEGRASGGERRRRGGRLNVSVSPAKLNLRKDTVELPTPTVSRAHVDRNEPGDAQK